MSKKADNKPAYVPTADEQAMMDDWLKRDRLKYPRVTVRISDDGAVSLGVAHDNETIGALQLIRALGLNSTGEYTIIKGQMVGMCRISEGAAKVEQQINELIAVVVAHEPKGITETMLCLQMAAVHVASCRAMQTVVNTDYAEARATASDTVNKLSRTFTMQLDALKRYRSKGREQRVVVEHKHYNFVAPGAQAVFMESNQPSQGGGVTEKAGPQSHERSSVLRIPEGSERPMKLVELALTEEAA